MLFTSPIFITIFLPAFLLATFLSPSARRNTVALVFSLFFYFWGAPAFLPTVLLMGAIDFGVSRALAVVRRRRLLLTVGVMAQLSILLYYKYLGFFAEQVVLLCRALGLPEPFAIPHILLPIGVSFIVFEQISYLVDVYRGDATPARTLPEYWTFLLLFPHSVAGPIFRWHDLDQQLRHRTIEDSDVARGFARFAFGLAKKALVANAVAHVADGVFALPAADLGVSIAWTGGLFYLIQIYFDFSGYSDMAIGLGRVIGFRFKENFRFPHLSCSITEFWERWHISLFTWFRLYVYIPLGGNRVSYARALLNVLIVFTISGFWHGAAWTYVCWGLFHGTLVVLERVTGRRCGFVGTQILAICGLVIFRANDLAHAGEYLRAMTGVKGNPIILSQSLARLVPYRAVGAAILGLFVIGFEPKILSAIERLDLRRAVLMTASLGLVAMAAVASSTYNPFIYFRF